MEISNAMFYGMLHILVILIHFISSVNIYIGSNNLLSPVIETPILFLQQIIRSHFLYDKRSMKDILNTNK